jgi:hypothetical protein
MAITVGAGTTAVDIDVEIAGQPLVRTGPLVGAVFGQGVGNRITYEVVADNIIEFKGGGGGPAAVDIVAIIMFPAEET